MADPRDERGPGPGRAPRPRSGAALLALTGLLAAASCARLPRGPRDGVETGVASWYGPAYHGRPTSSGEVFDMNDMTAAHPSLPFGTYVMVVNPANDRSVVVRINDRGPFAKGRIVDLSYAAARVLGLVGPGTARVRLEVLRGVRPPRDRPAASVWVQVGAFTVQENAYALKRRLDASYDGVVVSSLATGAGAYFRVRIKTDEHGAQALAKRLAAEGFSVVVVRE